MNPNLRERILRRLDTLSDERGYQVLDYVEFLESKYAERPQSTTSLFTKFTEGLEDRLRAGGVAATTVAETMGLMNRAVGMLEGVAAAGKSVANDIVSAAQRAATTGGAPGTGSGGTASSTTSTAAAGTSATGTTPGASGAPEPGASAPSATNPPSPAAGDQPT